MSVLKRIRNNQARNIAERKGLDFSKLRGFSRKTVSKVQRYRARGLSDEQIRVLLNLEGVK